MSPSILATQTPKSFVTHWTAHISMILWSDSRHHVYILLLMAQAIFGPSIKRVKLAVLALTAKSAACMKAFLVPATTGD